MRVTLVGGGKVGSFLARELHKSGHVVTVIEESHAHAEAFTDDSKVLALEGDGTDINLLEVADTDRSDWIVAVTGLDEVNLVACQIALTLGARRVLARLNNPLNRPTFEALDVPVVAVTDVMATLISRGVEVPELRHITLLGGARSRSTRSMSPPNSKSVRSPSSASPANPGSFQLSAATSSGFPQPPRISGQATT